MSEAERNILYRYGMYVADDPGRMNMKGFKLDVLFACAWGLSKRDIVSIQRTGNGHFSFLLLCILHRLISTSNASAAKSHV